MDVSKPSDVVNSRQTWAALLRKRWAIFLLVMVLVVTVLIGIVASAAIQGMMRVSSSSAIQFNAASLGDEVEIIFEVASMPSSSLLVGQFVEPNEDNTYRRASDTLNITLQSDTRIIMGQASDVQPGAVLQISGVKSAADSVTATRLVILTGYVTIR